MKNTTVKRNQAQGKYNQTDIPVTEEISKTDYDTKRNGFLEKVDAFLTWILCKLLPKSLTSCPPPDRQIYY